MQRHLLTPPFFALLVVSAVACAAPVASDPAIREGQAEQTEAPLSSGISFVFTPLDARIVPTSWDLRVISSRKVWGCYDYDVLQGSGWFPATWYQTYTPVARGGSYVVELERTVRGTLCDAKMDTINGVGVQLADPSATGGMLSGSIVVNPDGARPDVTVTCRRNPAGEGYVSMLCDEAHVKVPARGTATIRIAWGS